MADHHRSGEPGAAGGAEAPQAAAGAPATVLASLALRPAEERAGILHDLQRRAGNASVARLLAPGDADGP